jgi:hypothetical protein
MNGGGKVFHAMGRKLTPKKVVSGFLALTLRNTGHHLDVLLKMAFATILGGCGRLIEAVRLLSGLPGTSSLLEKFGILGRILGKSIESLGEGAYANGSLLGWHDWPSTG